MVMRSCIHACFRLTSLLKPEAALCVVEVEVEVEIQVRFTHKGHNTKAEKQEKEKGDLPWSTGNCSLTILYTRHWAVSCSKN